MRDNQNTDPALGSEAVDDRFWALICDDEQWLRAEFDGIVSEPAEHPTSPRPLMVITTDRDRPARSGGADRPHRPAAEWDHPAGSGPDTRAPAFPARSAVHDRCPPDPISKVVMTDQQRQVTTPKENDPSVRQGPPPPAPFPAHRCGQPGPITPIRDTASASRDAIIAAGRRTPSHPHRVTH
jgi:hypothetical protein